MILRRVDDFGFEKHFQEVSLSELLFYKFVMKTWKTAERNVNSREQWVPGELLFFNQLIQTWLLSSASIQQGLLKNGIVKLGHLFRRGRVESDRRSQRSNEFEIFTSGIKAKSENLQFFKIRKLLQYKKNEMM